MFDLLVQADAMPHRHLRQGDAVYKEGQACDGNIFIIIDGTVTEIAGSGQKQRSVKEFTVGAFFGDIEVLSGADMRLRTMKVTSTSLVLAIMDQHNSRVLGGLYPEFFLHLLRSAIDNLNVAEKSLLEQRK
ncbi:MAG: cyclic nucleotide-binding domain-containing protein [Turneriella sp.]